MHRDPENDVCSRSKFKTCTSFAGFFVVVQCTVGVILAGYHLDVLYWNPKRNDIDLNHLREVTRKNKNCIECMLVVMIFVYPAWLISTVIMLYGNIAGKARFLHQWILITIIIIVACDITMTTVFLLLTLESVLEFRKGVRYQVFLNLFDSYLVLGMSFSRVGIFTCVANICLVILTSLRKKRIIATPEVTPPPRTPFRPFRLESSSKEDNHLQKADESPDSSTKNSLENSCAYLMSASSA